MGDVRILIAAQNYFARNNGQAVFARALSRGLAGRGHEVSVLTPSEDGPEHVCERGGVRIHSLRSITLDPFYRGVSVTYAAGDQVRAILDFFVPEVVHVQDHFPLCRAVVCASARARAPIVATNHFMPQNLIPFVPVLSRFEQARGAMDRLLWKQVVRLFRRADVVTTPTRTAARLLEGAGLGMHVHAVSCGVDLKRFRPLPAVDTLRPRRKYGIDPAAIALLYVGRVDREKRIDVLLHAMKLLGRKDVQLVVAGRGHDRASLQALAAQLELDSAARFPGFIEDEDVPGLLNSVNVFVMPSEAELQSIATLEAMACARPILASDAGALPELVESGVNGLLFRANESEHAAMQLRRLLAERHRWPAMGQASLKKAREHSVERTVDEYERLYREAILLRPPRAQTGGFHGKERDPCYGTGL